MEDKYAHGILDVCAQLHGSRVGTGDPLPDAEHDKLVDWLTRRVTEGWDTFWDSSSASGQSSYDNAVKALARAALEEATNKG